MKFAAVLLAASVAGCGGIDFPEETGAPPRAWPPGIVVHEVEKDLADMPRYESGGFASGRTWLNGQRCTIWLPKASVSPDYVHTVSPADVEHIRTHELRHCTGQQHDRKEVSPGVFVIVWQP